MVGEMGGGERWEEERGGGWEWWRRVMDESGRGESGDGGEW